MARREVPSKNDKYFSAEIWCTNFGGGKFRIKTINRAIYKSGHESTASFTARTMKAQRQARDWLKLKAEFCKKPPDVKIIWKEKESS